MVKLKKFLKDNQMKWLSKPRETTLIGSKGIKINYCKRLTNIL